MKEKNKNLLNEINNIKGWMNYLNGAPGAKRLKLIKESEYDDTNDQFGTPETSSEDLILGSQTNSDDMINDGSFIVISIDINGGIHVTMVSAEDENSAIEQTENEMIIQNMVISEDALMELISKLSQYLPEDLVSGEESDKPPFIDEPDEEIIDEYSI